MAITPNATIAKIGNFFGTKVAEIMALISTRPTTEQVRVIVNEAINASGNPATVGSYPFEISLNPVIAHNTGKQIASVSIYDAAGCQHFAYWETLDDDRIKIGFTEAVQGRCVITFQG